VNVDRHHAPAGDRGVLDREVTQAADAEDGDERVPATLTALYVVTPAQASGAASNGSMPSGTLTT
jgi:hypothetical protein